MGRSSHTEVVVLGAGLTGLSAALRLASDGVQFRVFEQCSEVGGHAITIEDEGYRFDRTGHLLHVRDEGLRQRVRSWIGDDHAQLQRRSVVFSQGVYTRYPFQANAYGLPPQIAYDCVWGFIVAQTTQHRTAPRNFEEYCIQRFGEGISRHFMIPYNTKVWGIPPTEITSDWCQRFVPVPRLEEVIAGALGRPGPELGYNTEFLYPRLGIGVLPRAMHRELGDRVELNRAPQRIDPERRSIRFPDETVSYQVLVSTIPLPRLLGLLDATPETLRRAAARLRSTGLYYLDVALNVPCRQEVHWVYVPEPRYPFYRVGCYSNFSSALAPPGCASLYVELAPRTRPVLSELLPHVAASLVELNLIQSPRDISFARVRHIDPAYVIFDHDYYAALDTIRPFLAEHAIISTGRYGGWNYSSMEDALLFGEAAALRAAERIHA